MPDGQTQISLTAPPRADDVGHRRGTNVLDRVQGRPTDRPQTFDEGPLSLDTNHLSPEEAEDALECARRLQRYLMLAAERAPRIETDGFDRPAAE